MKLLFYIRVMHSILFLFLFISSVLSTGSPAIKKTKKRNIRGEVFGSVLEKSRSNSKGKELYAKYETCIASSHLHNKQVTSIIVFNIGLKRLNILGRISGLK